jgi:hypothetical protein
MVAGPYLHRGADARAEAASDVGIVVEGDLVAAEAEAVDIRPVDGDGGQRFDEGAVAERAEAVAGVGAYTHGGGIERVGEAQGLVSSCMRCTLSRVSTNSPPLK